MTAILHLLVTFYGEGNGTPTPVLLPGKSHGWRSLVGCSPRGCKESDTSDFTFTFHFHALEKEMATTHSSVLAWRILGTGEPSRLQSMGSHRVGRDWSDLAAAVHFKWLKHFCALKSWKEVRNLKTKRVFTKSQCFFQLMDSFGLIIHSLVKTTRENESKEINLMEDIPQG